MSNYDHILAKSKANGGTTLKDHLQSVHDFAVKAAIYAELDPIIAGKGAILHDIGKVSPLFQRKLNGYRPNPLEMNFRHEIASLFFLSLIEEDSWSPIIDMIVAHHKSIGKDGRELGILDLDYYYDDQVFEFHAKGFDQWSLEAIGLLVECGFQRKEISMEDAKKSYQYALTYCQNKKTKGWSIWKGLLIGADQIASALMGRNEITPILFEKPDVTFYNRKHDLFPLSSIPSVVTQRHTFVKAPTGAGKTDFLLKRCRGRIFYTLPFQASINAMFERIRNDLNGKTNDIRLLHSISRIVINGSKMEEKVIQDKFGAAIKVLTPHQLAAIAFGTRGYESILFDLKGCDIILDEIHTYSDIIQSIVLKIVEILSGIGCNIHIGTATMPSALEKSLLNLLDRKQVQYVELKGTALDTFDRHIIHKIESFEEIYGIIRSGIEHRQKCLIVANTVAKAQTIFEQIEEEHPDVIKLLIHSRFNRKDRNWLERELKEKYNVCTEACIVVSTQVVEVSLDISFDMMITETAPIDAMIQRFGRVNRRRDETTIGKYKSIFVLAPVDGAKEARPYTLEILKQSYAVLPNNELLKESELQRKIDQVYPSIETIDINLDAVYANGAWRLRELWHLPKSALLEKLDIDSVACITQNNREYYLEASIEERTLMEIPVSYNSIKYKQLDQLSVGSNPFIIPDNSYSSEKGLDMNKATRDNYSVQYQFI